MGNSTHNNLDITSYTSHCWCAGSRYMLETGNEHNWGVTWVGGDAYTAPVMALSYSGNTVWLYLLRDYLGNITHITNSSGSVLYEYSYDAWGRRRDKDTWGYSIDDNQEILAGRGFTSHEFLPWFNLYNMNGRLYDPVIGRFLSPDPYIQRPGFTQGYNRYSYVLNNPLKYADPTGMKKKPIEEEDYFDLMRLAYELGEHISRRKGGGGDFPYSYNAGQYYDNEGNNVPFEEVFYTYIEPNDKTVSVWASSKDFKTFRGLHFGGGITWYTENGFDALVKIISGVTLNDDPYHNGHGETIYTMDEFLMANKGLTRSEIINQRQNRSKTFLDSQPGGPNMRYVINPHDGRVLDMRHMLVIGNQPIVLTTFQDEHQN